MENKSKVYILLEGEIVVRCEGGYTVQNIENISEWVLIDEGVGDRYNLCQAHYFDGGLYTADGIPRYKRTGAEVVLRTEEEISADRARVSEVQVLPS